ncbi:type II toxin-antitoxin system prevent-host-death family antitoxin [Candidatus Finniella inopinata]|uniref:Antitoxin n=1 Tax=Candidatus Finniella inopinata TaxID=1696036 RepID=A0A4Q7DL36_9PROT|nr:type II toxin-antitoxin system prevent-host-death family antitoxin [Candidatus Finniella inopinata]RZI47059.1 type II toxin-antitoxin system prevent-host-death family antitoxin [Candidatus Finniella inopinata]
MQSWPLKEAKAKFSEVVRKATVEGPQEVTIRGQQQVVVLSKKAYEELLNPKASFLEFISSSPLKGVELDLRRSSS